jgi:hypothetical protein
MRLPPQGLATARLASRIPWVVFGMHNRTWSLFGSHAQDAASPGARDAITETSRIHWVVFGMQNRTWSLFGSHPQDAVARGLDDEAASLGSLGEAAPTRMEGRRLLACWLRRLWDTEPRLRVRFAVCLLSACLPVCRSFYLSICLWDSELLLRVWFAGRRCPSVRLSIWRLWEAEPRPRVRFAVCPFVCLSVHLSVYLAIVGRGAPPEGFFCQWLLSVRPSVNLSMCPIARQASRPVRPRAMQPSVFLSV